MINHKLKYNVLDKVLIRELNITGRIIGIFVGIQSDEYRVRYFDNCTPQFEYFYEDELQLINEDKDASL